MCMCMCAPSSNPMISSRSLLVCRDIVPSGEVRSDFNFDTDGDNKRVLNVEHVVNDSDNIKQDMSIDVYGRGSEDDDSQSEANIAELYNV